MGYLVLNHAGEGFVAFYFYFWKCFNIVVFLEGYRCIGSSLACMGKGQCRAHHGCMRFYAVWFNYREMI
ncbi:hypothetical protein D3C78_1531820 [compost metagenome]